VCFNATSNDDLQGRSLLDMSVGEVLQPVVKALTAHVTLTTVLAPHAERRGPDPRSPTNPRRSLRYRDVPRVRLGADDHRERNQPHGRCRHRLTAPNGALSERERLGDRQPVPTRPDVNPVLRSRHVPSVISARVASR
jgi:hypothetical protein